MNQRQHFDRRGAALIIVLAFLVVLSGIVVAYLGRTASDRQLSQGTFNETRSDILARSALNIVVADLKQEIANGSTVSTVDGYTIYTPSANANMQPMLSGTPAPTPVPSSNIIRRSIRSDPIVAPGVPSRASAVNSTTDVSLNGRSVTAARWNKHYLIPRVNASSSAVDSTPVASFTAPDWVLVSRNGPLALSAWNPAIADPSASNGDFVTGRYGYAIYDEGGLLDVNVAGYPSPTPSPSNYVQTVGRKGSVAYADLTSLPTSTATPAPSLTPARVNQIVGWRNYASTQPSGSITGNSFAFNLTSAQNFMNLVANNTGFLTVSSSLPYQGSTDQAFATRQQLIDFRTATGDVGFSQNVLQFMGTFSRELNRANWKPATSSAVNPDLQSVRVAGTFTRSDGSQAIVGEPLLKTRFSLTKLNNLPLATPSPIPSPSPAAIPAVQRDFGLLWDGPNARWNYVGASGSAVQTSIKTLATVASENREPNFFEILKAVVLNGSVGLGSGPGNTFVVPEPKYYNTTGGLSADHQIMQIGANIIDAWDSDPNGTLPTFIYFASDEIAGIENLPYLNKLVFMPSFASGSGDFFDAWLVPSLWNPHRNAPGTGIIRVALTGSAQLSATGTAKQGSTVTTTTAGPITPLPATMDISSAGFATPGPQSTTPISRTSSVTQVTDPSLPYWGFHFPFTASTPNATLVTKQDADTAYPDFGSIVGASNLELQIQLPGTNTFKSYQVWKIAATGHPLVCAGSKGNFAASNKLQDPEFVALDPRTTRFGIWGSDANAQTGARAKKDFTQGEADSLDEQNPASRFEQITLYSPQGSSFLGSLPTNLYLYSSNTGAGSTPRYIDLDGVQRSADFVADNGTSQGSTIMYGANSSNRQQLPNTPFQSVAELGQVSRDQPWKTLALTIANSGDAGLLDVFSLQDVPLTAGRVSLNTRQYPVLAAVLSKAGLRLDGSSILSTTQANNIAKAVVAATAANPLLSKADLVSRVAADSTVTGLGNKEARECVMRALTDAGQTRTWNLMIDVIAQSGRYPRTAASLADFVVEGEKRYWLHIAIDRFTGEVIDQQLEAVYE